MLLAQACTLAGSRDLAQPLVSAGLVRAELHLRGGAVGEAERAAEDLVCLARAQGRRLAEALAWRLRGQCALARGAPTDAEPYLRLALATQSELGAALEAARTRLVLAEALAAGADTSGIRDEARALLAEACTQFAMNGAAPDLARAERLAAAWETP
jgi:hypothetical protein